MPAIAALLVGGVFLHSSRDGGLFTNVDLLTDSGREDIPIVIEQVLDMAFDSGQNKDQLTQ